MKRFFIIFLFCSAALAGQGQESKPYIVTYVDSISHLLNPGFCNTVTKTTETKSLQSRQGKIIVHFQENHFISEGVEHCLKLAMDLWEEKLNLAYPITFEVKVSENMDPDTEILTKVGYCLDHEKALPSSLFYQRNHTETGTTNCIDINALVDWNSSWSFDIPYGNDNLTTALLRHIAHILGFGTSVVNDHGNTVFAIPQFASVFDHLVVDNHNNTLGSLAQNASAGTIEAFLKQELSIQLPTGKYKLYSTPEAYVPFRSGCYLSLNKENLMNYPYKDKTKLLPVNVETLNILEAIGWEVKPHDISIEGSNLDVTGYGSAYSPHTFQAIDTKGTVIDNPVWAYQIYDNVSKKYIDRKNGEGMSFTVIPDVENINHLDKFQCLQARVVCSVTDGTEIKQYTYPLSLETKPQVTSYKITNVQETDDKDYFSFDVTLCYQGSQNGTLSVCNEYSMAADYPIRQANEIKIHIPRVLKVGMTYLDLTLENEYGTTIKRFYLDNYNDTNNITSPTHPSDAQNADEVLYIYSLHGVKYYKKNKS